MTVNDIRPPVTVLRELRAVVAKAARAPSIHNTQPWIFVAAPTELDIYADRRRQLPVIDPSGRQLILSCGCVLFNVRVAAAAARLDARVTLLPDATQGDLLARVDVAPSARDTVTDGDVSRLASAILRRHSNRRRFSDEPVPGALVRRLTTAAALEGAMLNVVTSSAHRAALAELSRRADATQTADPAYRAELRAWTSADPARLDGVGALVVPHVEAGSGDEVPIRDFDSHGSGFLPTETRSTRRQCLLVLTNETDDVRGWLNAGEALERVLLEITDAGYVASLFSQVVEVAATRAELRHELRLPGYPMMVVRVGRAAPTPGTQRRRVADIFSGPITTG